ncbi:hypothetical protein CATMQ487_19940 [Sphaerotilus microaerophilus]|uniref:Uncharacterized protein n=1 Tax=Sphaerotilus microaerophilus TaxID=2914710 RepID=A0ABN6PJ15_9BURK|nr:hypothetical protein CATMQ487_19940 [Sphaerotilus sp. FB-5]
MGITYSAKTLAGHVEPVHRDIQRMLDLADQVGRRDRGLGAALPGSRGIVEEVTGDAHGSGSHEGKTRATSAAAAKT